MSAGAWVVVIVWLWLLIAVPAALAAGRVVRNRDRQIPRDEP